jgi:hypothetical protein
MLAERRSLLVIQTKVADVSAKVKAEGFNVIFTRIDARSSLSMTYNKGQAMPQHEKLSVRIGESLHFKYPHNIW